MSDTGPAHGAARTATPRCRYLATFWSGPECHCPRRKRTRRSGSVQGMFGALEDVYLRPNFGSSGISSPTPLLIHLTRPC